VARLAEWYGDDRHIGDADMSVIDRLKAWWQSKTNKGGTEKT
jgi:hypothetical protein